MRNRASLFLFWTLLFCCKFLRNPSLVVYGLCLEDQQSLLLYLKKELKFEIDGNEGFSVLDSWNQSLCCCHWSGVACDEDGHVISLDLSDQFIFGGLHDSSALFRLHHLRDLNLSFNSFNSPIPPAIKNLQNLTSLDLADAFAGEIPIAISQLTRLVTLDLSSSLMFDKSTLDITFLQNLTRIRQLYLDGVIISSAEGQVWSNVLLAFLGLEQLSMSYCDLSGPIESSLTGLVNLSMIVLDGNNLSSTVPEAFANFEHLSILSLYDCGLIGLFPQKIFQIPTLSFIDISDNIDLYGLLPGFPLCGSLNTLRASNTNFSGVLPNSVSNLRHLYTLELSNCLLVGILPTSLSNLTELTYLDLSFNSFSGPIPSFVLLKNLMFLDLSHNGLLGANLSNHIVGALQNLVYLDLSYNSLGGRIPSSLFALSLLQEIYLSFNHFDGQIDEFSISSSTLYVLDLSNNHLEGPFPLSVFKLNKLQVLQLSSNKFSGILKVDVIQSLRSLTTLDISHNDLFIDVNALDATLSTIANLETLNLASCKLKEFPLLERSKQLTNLDLSNNQIQGLIPNWIWKLNLTNLNLSCNYLTGFEGSWLNHSSSWLLVLDLHSNQLQGEIPLFVSSSIPSYLDYSNNNFSTIGSHAGTYLSSAVYLYLSENKFSGMIPHSLCNASLLLVLDLSNNNFEGPIPHCLTRIDLSVLSLGNNMLNGNLPNTFPEPCFLSTLDIHQNKLVGLVPKSLSKCMDLEVLDLGNNQIKDHFPCFLKKISTLRVIVLRTNKFEGPLGCLDDNATWPVLQIIDLAFNNFSGLLPIKAFKTWEAMIYTITEDDDVSINGSQAYYQNSVTVTSKGQQMKFVKIRTLTLIDLSSNKFEGPIPRELMNLKGLHVLNLSHNALSGHIPSSIDSLKQLESLDLSINSLSGEIPTQLAALSFLEFLNLSFNHLEGKIPTGTQLQSFEASSFQGNDGLYGPPFTSNTKDGKQGQLPPPVPSNHHEIDLKFITGMELGVVFGLGIVIGPLFFWKQWRIRYWKCVDNILCWVFPQLYYDYQRHEGQMYAVLRWNHH